MAKPLADALRESGFEAPNLDDLSIDPEDLLETARLFSELSSYAMFKANAMVCRRNGFISSAQASERICEAVYKRLPNWARW